MYWYVYFLYIVSLRVRRFHQVYKADPENEPRVDSQNITKEKSVVRIMIMSWISLMVWVNKIEPT